MTIDSLKIWMKKFDIPYSLKITPFDHKPPLTICKKFVAEVYKYLQFMPPLTMNGMERKNSMTPTNEKKIRTHRTTLYRILLPTGQ